jgi:hypothetical protein
VDNDTGSERAYFAYQQTPRDRRWRCDRVAMAAAASPITPAALPVVLMSSLGLWAMIWLAVSAVISAVLS